MKALFRVSDGWIITENFSPDKINAHEESMCKSGEWAEITIAEGIKAGNMQSEYRVINGSFVYIPEEERPGYVSTEMMEEEALR